MIKNTFLAALLLLIIAALAVAWFAKSPSAAVILEEVSIAAPHGVAVKSFARTGSDIDHAFVATISLRDGDWRSICAQPGLKVGGVDSLPEPVRRTLSVGWHESSRCHKNLNTKTQWEFVLVSEKEVLVFVQSL
jgi:hypothetical protein